MAANAVLDTKLLPVLSVPAVRQGDGLHCPYCGVGIQAHEPGAQWQVSLDEAASSV